MNKGLVLPRLRFKDFNDEWHIVHLNNISKEVHGNDGNVNNIPILTISALKGWMKQKDRFNNIIAGKELKRYTLLHKNELSYNHGNSKAAQYGVVTTLRNYNMALVPKIYHSFRMIDDNNALFIDYLFSSKKPDQELRKVITSGARQDGLLNINRKNFFNIKINVPEAIEQQHIGAFFAKLDRMIELQSKKITHLKQLKKGYLQKMFPQKGKNVPRLRFDGFRDEWKSYSLGKIFDTVTDYVSNGSFKSLKENVQSFKTPNYAYLIRLQDASNNWQGPWLYTNKKGYDYLNKSKLFEHDIIMSNVGSVGKFFNVPKLDRPMTLAPNAILLRSSKYNNTFLFQLLLQQNTNSKVIRMSTPGVQNKINKTDFKSINTLIPNIKEQNLIGIFLNNVDDLIYNQKSIINNLKKLKKAYLQKMFI